VGSEKGAARSVGALCGKPGGRAPLLGILKDMLNKALKSGVFFHRGLVLGNMEGMLLSKGLREICKRRLWKRTTLSMGPRCGTWRGVLLPGTLRYSKAWAPFLGPRGC